MHSVLFRSLSGLAAIALTIILSACQDHRQVGESGYALAAIQERGVLRVGIKGDSPPFGQAFGETVVGFDADIITAVAQRMGLDVAFTVVDASNRISTLTSGEVDAVIASMTITRSRDVMVDFSIPYFQDGQGLLTHQDSSIDSYLDCYNKRVGCLANTTSVHTMQQVAPGADILTVESYDALLSALEERRVDAISTDMLILRGLQQRSAQALVIAGDRFSTEPYGIAVRENQSDLRDQINFALQEIWEDGEWQSIYLTWFGPGTAFAEQIPFAITPFPK